MYDVSNSTTATMHARATPSRKVRPPRISTAVIPLCLLSLLVFARQGVYGQNRFLATLAATPGGVVITYGTDASSLTAAIIIRDAIRQLPGQSFWNNLRPAAEFDADTFTVTGQVHVIAVGTLADNVVLQGRNWLPSWWMDWTWYTTKYPYALSGQRIGIPYQYSSGFVAGGFGGWADSEKRIGLIEVDRSSYFMEWLVRGRLEKYASNNVRNIWATMTGGVDRGATGAVSFPTYPRDFPLRLMVRITGSGDSGVVGAARAFAQNGLLNGVVLNGAAADAKPAMFTLTASRYRTVLPFTPPDTLAGYRCIGWLLPDAFEYDGFRKNAGVSPQQMFYVKYMPSFGIVSFWTSPHRRAGEFAICAAKFATASEAQTAKTTLDNAVSAMQGYKDGRIKDFGTAVNGNVLYVQSIPNGSALLQAFAGLPTS